MDAEEYYVISTPVKNTIFCLLSQVFTHSFFGESGEKIPTFSGMWYIKQLIVMSTLQKSLY